MKSRRRKLSPEEDEQHGHFDASPLIDVSFLLLIFFLLTSMIRKEETDLGLRLPTPDGQTVATESLMLEIVADATGKISLNGEELASDLDDHRLPALVGELRRSRELAEASDLPVTAMIDIDDEASQQRFADVLNALAAADIKAILNRS